MVDRPVTLPAEDARTMMLNRIAWGAVFAGVVIALVTQLILNMIGVGIGVSTLNPGAGASANPSAMSLSIGAGVWFLLSGVIASFAGGYAAGRLAGKPKESTAGWHGLTAWALTTLVIFYLLTSTASSLVGGAYSTVTGALGGVSRTVGATAQTALQAAAPSLSQVTDPFSAIENQIRGVTGGNDPAALRDAAITAIRATLTGDQAQAQAARNRAVAALARAQNIPEDQARAQIQQYEQQYRQAVDQAKLRATQAADAAAQAVSRSALFGSLALVVGALAGWFGGRTGTVYPALTETMLAPAVRTGFAESVSRSELEAGRQTTAGEPIRQP
ncbi:PhnA-like protein [Microvirga alba]|uniref:PhnA-like protein n=1 Tax=Microvirga alba TaxID=2791025 RepID=A0A931BKU5_9HYPH|nr:PhnA-like protein [Microvirga alba]MBF9233086.1 PhnA-like protein [Microvirga alba]